jgi:hypothetical protein
LTKRSLIGFIRNRTIAGNCEITENLDDEVYVAKVMGQPEEEIRAWLLERLNRLANGEE